MHVLLARRGHPRDTAMERVAGPGRRDGRALRSPGGAAHLPPLLLNRGCCASTAPGCADHGPRPRAAVAGRTRDRRVTTLDCSQQRRCSQRCGSGGSAGGRPASRLGGRTGGRHVRFHNSHDPGGGAGARGADCAPLLRHPSDCAASPYALLVFSRAVRWLGAIMECCAPCIVQLHVCCSCKVEPVPRCSCSGFAFPSHPLLPRMPSRQVGSTVFVHGGVLPAHTEYGIERINR
jgi:hypothetical protein